MYLGAYHFDGDPAVLVPAYERLMAAFPIESIDLHVCVIRDTARETGRDTDRDTGRGTGITVYDACPSSDVFRSFSSGAEFAGAISAAGLPAPRVEPIGEVHRAHLRQAVPS